VPQRAHDAHPGPYRCEAVIVVGPTIPMRDLVALSTQLPTVVLARRVAGGAVDVVRTDDIDGAGVARLRWVELTTIPQDIQQLALKGR
jgi:hypothetical protein